MDTQTAVETFKFNSIHQPYFITAETSIHKKPLPPSNNGLMDLSFSTYLSNEPLEKPSKAPVLDDSEINVFDAQKYFGENNDHPKESDKTKMSSSNIKLIPNPNDSVSSFSSVSTPVSVDRYGKNFRVRSFHSTPTGSSEASWNSQTGLLSKPHGDKIMMERTDTKNIETDNHRIKRSGSSGSKWFFCRKCPCVGKKSLQVIGEEISTTRTSSLGSDYCSNVESNLHSKRTVHLQKLPNVPLKSSVVDELSKRQQRTSSNLSRIQSENPFIFSNDIIQQRVRATSTTPRPFGGHSAGGFSFPVLKQGSEDFPSRTSGKTSFDEPSRESLEVFQPTYSLNSRKVTEDEVASDASSDLFEIESLSTQTTYRRRDSLEETPSPRVGRFLPTHGYDVNHQPITPITECYAPSEASIDWSVTTAEGIDRTNMTSYSIASSDYEDSTITRLRSMEKYGVEATTGYISSIHWNEGGGNKKKMGNGLMGCRHEKAVSVGPSPMKSVQEGPPLPLISIPGHVSRATKTNLQQSGRGHSDRLSLAFAA